jgi:hypothetical protein
LITACVGCEKRRFVRKRARVRKNERSKKIIRSSSAALVYHELFEEISRE